LEEIENTGGAVVAYNKNETFSFLSKFMGHFATVNNWL
jgi:hypothetical protein